jgi:hypothetical protein
MTFGQVTEAETKKEGAISDLAEAALNELDNIAPESVRSAIAQAKTSLAPASTFLEKQMPKFLKLYDVVVNTWAGAQQYQPLQYSSVFIGLLMIFFGGTFGATIAAVETFHHLAYEDTKEALTVLYKQYQIADDAANKDEDQHALSVGDRREAELRRRALRGPQQNFQSLQRHLEWLFWCGVCFAREICTRRLVGHLHWQHDHGSVPSLW